MQSAKYSAMTKLTTQANNNKWPANMYNQQQKPSFTVLWFQYFKHQIQHPLESKTEIHN